MRENTYNALNTKQLPPPTPPHNITGGNINGVSRSFVSLWTILYFAHSLLPMAYACGSGVLCY